MSTAPTHPHYKSPDKIRALFELERKVMELRVKGTTFTKINSLLNITNASSVFRRAIQRDANVEFRRQEALRLEESRLDQLQEGIWGRALNGEPRAVEVALKVLERRARLLGLDFADGISAKLVEVEQAKVVLLATALEATLADIGVSAIQREQALTSFFQRLRDNQASPAPSAIQYSSTPEIIEGEVVNDMPDADEDLLL